MREKGEATPAQHPKSWPPVDTSGFPEHKRRVFNLRKRILDLHLLSNQSMQAIADRLDVSLSEIKRIVKRALTESANGECWGYYACIPGFRLKEYSLRKASDTSKAGRFTQFLEHQPNLQSALDGWALGYKKINSTKVRGKTYKRIWKAFREAAIAQGLDPEVDYPFSNADGGQGAVRDYCRRLKQRHAIRGAIVDFGDAAGRLLASAYSDPVMGSIRPYDLVQLDGHRIDLIIIVRLTTAEGEHVDLPLARIWLLTAMDVRSRAVLGYALSLSENYTSEDVLECVSRIFIPWKARALPSHTITYERGAGLPSGLIKGCAWRCFNGIRMDNAWAQQSSWTQGRLIATGVNEVITNRPKRPRTNAIVERFFHTFEQETGHEMPNTCGSGPQDPRRRDPEAAAQALSIDYEDLECIVDVALANYNALPHDALHGRNPLEYLRYALDEQFDIPRYLRPADRVRLPLFEHSYKVTIRGNLKTGHPPYIQFKQARYSSKTLALRIELIGTEARLRVNSQDLRRGRLFMADGTCLGEVDVEAKWQFHHSLRTRRAINKLVKTRKIAGAGPTLLRDYMQYLEQRASLGRRERNKLLKARREAGASDTVLSSDPRPTKRYRGPDWVTIRPHKPDK